MDTLLILRAIISRWTWLDYRNAEHLVVDLMAKLTDACP